MGFLRRTLAVLLVCGPGGMCRAEWAPSPSPFRIVASFYPVWLAVRNVAGGIEGVEVVNLTRPTVGCLHDYALTPEDLKRLEGASVLVINGLGMESFLDRLLTRVSIPVVDSSKDILLPSGDGKESCMEGDGHAPHPCGHDHHAEHGRNPHLWLSVTFHIGQVSNIVTGLSRLDPARGQRYRANGEQYIARLAELRDRIREELKPLASRTLITFHPAFEHFARDFDLRIAAVITPDPSAMPTPRDMARLVRLIKEENIRGLFVEPATPPRLAETLTRESGVRTAVLDPITTGPEADDYYLRRMELNARTIREILGTHP